MGFWDVGPFDNDDAADFAAELDGAPAGARIDMVGRVLERVATADEDSDVWDAPRALAAAALIAAQRPGGEPVCSTYGPSTPMPQFPDYLIPLAVDSLDRVVATAWLADNWTDAAHRMAWRRTIRDLRGVLQPPQRESLFDL